MKALFLELLAKLVLWNPECPSARRLDTISTETQSTCSIFYWNNSETLMLRADSNFNGWFDNDFPCLEQRAFEYILYLLFSDRRLFVYSWVKIHLSWVVFLKYSSGRPTRIRTQHGRQMKFYPYTLISMNGKDAWYNYTLNLDDLQSTQRTWAHGLKLSYRQTYFLASRVSNCPTPWLGAPCSKWLEYCLTVGWKWRWNRHIDMNHVMWCNVINVMKLM